MLTLLTAFVLAVIITVLALCIAFIGVIFGLIWKFIIWLFGGVITLFRGY